MNKEINQEKIKIRIEIFRIYSFFLIGLITGITSLLLRNNFYKNIIELNLLIVGVIFFIIVIYLFFKSLSNLNKILKR